jgi:hypothetical protein
LHYYWGYIIGVKGESSIVRATVAISPSAAVAER